MDCIATGTTGHGAWPICDNVTKSFATGEVPQ
jgi:hypothetical protein